MKGGFGKFLTFILGIVVGVLLVGGTIAGVVYYAVAAVSVNDVENYTKQEFTFIDKDAEIRDYPQLRHFNRRRRLPLLLRAHFLYHPQLSHLHWSVCFLLLLRIDKAGFSGR